MKIYGIAVVKNEADIIAYSLSEASRWVDRIFVLDNGSTDGTWEKVNELAGTTDVIVPWRQLPVPFSNGLRALVFNEFRHLAREVDWWCMRLDADEFYVNDPRIFLTERIKNYYNVVCSRHIQYQLTDVDLTELQFTLPVPEVIAKLKYISPLATSEIRFFRHRNRLRWSPEEEVPRLLGMVSPERILIRHFQHRSPEQLTKRIATRLGAQQQPGHIFAHLTSAKTEDYIVKAEDCLLDKGDISIYNSLPLANNKNLHYPWWTFWAYRILQATKILT